jgi:hypothetical protein
VLHVIDEVAKLLVGQPSLLIRLGQPSDDIVCTVVAATQLAPSWVSEWQWHKAHVVGVEVQRREPATRSADIATRRAGRLPFAGPAWLAMDLSS